MNKTPQDQAKAFLLKKKKKPAKALADAVEGILHNQSTEVLSPSRDTLLVQMGAAQTALWALAESLGVEAKASAQAYMENPILEDGSQKIQAKQEPEMPAGTAAPAAPLETPKTGGSAVAKPKKRARQRNPQAKAKRGGVSPRACAQRLVRNKKGRAYIERTLAERFGTKAAQEAITGLWGKGKRPSTKKRA
jgi:hypothetical protein